jgi:hypothetical protein
MKTIAVVDLGTGRIQERRRNTLTLDIPLDLDWATGGVSVDATSLGHYFAAGGQRLVYATRPSLLSGRGLGAECLVADDLNGRTGETCLQRYRLSAVERRISHAD